MSGIYINGMKMPKQCRDCKLKYWNSEEEVCPFVGIIAPIGRHDACPLVFVPNHGRLIDADTLAYNIEDVPYKGSVRRVLLSAPTIIEAEEGER